MTPVRMPTGSPPVKQTLLPHPVRLRLVLLIKTMVYLFVRPPWERQDMTSSWLQTHLYVMCRLGIARNRQNLHRFTQKSSKRLLAHNKIIKITFVRTKVANMTTLVGPKWAHKQQIHMFLMFIARPRRARGRQEHKQPSGPGHFGVTLVPLWGYFWVILGTLRLPWGYFDHVRMTFESHWPVFKRHSFFQ